MLSKNHSKELLEDCRALIDNCQSLMLATSGDDSSHCSYVPFIWMGDCVYILVSALAEHTGNLKNAGQNKIGGMLIEDESACQQIFARRRLMFKSTVEEITRDSENWPGLMSEFKQQYGEIIDMLDSLPDFTIFKLRPQQLLLVKGFGDAHQIESGLAV